MSYTKTYSKRIAVPFHGSVRYTYPASEHGGSGTAHYDGTAYEDVQVNIRVDTDPFDSSVRDCAHRVDTLTGSVVATEAAQVASIHSKAKQIGDTIVEGFFSTVRFEISTQIVELKKRVEALLLDMNEKQKKLIALKTQMDKDYHRTSERYGSIFADLNQELDNRVHALDQPVFAAATNIYQAEDRFMETDMLNIVALAGKENAILEAQIGTAIAKKHARLALSEAQTFIAKKQATETTLNRCTLDDNREQQYFAPICCVNMVDQNNVVNMQAYASQILPSDVQNSISNHVDMKELPELTEEEKENISIYFNTLMNESDATDAHSTRVKKLISKLYSI